MKKLIFTILLFVCIALPSSVLAANVVEIGTEGYETLPAAIADAEEGAIIKLLDNVTVPNATRIEKDLTINLNGFNISATEKTFEIQGATVNFTGEGMIYESTPNYSPIRVYGANTSQTDYTVITIGEDVTLKGFYGIQIIPYESMVQKFAYGVVINMNGKTITASDPTGANGSGIYVNGQMTHKENCPIINVSSTAEIKSTGAAIYAAGYAKWNLTGGTYEGVDSAFGIKAGVFNIGSVTAKVTGPKVVPTVNNNGIEASGSTIQIESNPNGGYAGDIELNITGGKYSSANGHIIYEYIPGTNTETEVNVLNITGGTFGSLANEEETIVLSSKLQDKIKGFVKGGTYNTNPAVYMATGYQVKLDTTKGYEVSRVTIPVGTKTVSGTITNGNNATVQLIQGGLVVKSTNASDTGVYEFTNVANGVYNVLATSGSNSVTALITVKDADVTKNLTIGSGAFTTIAVGDTAPNVMVGGLQEQYDDDNVQLTVVGSNRDQESEPQNQILEEATTSNVQFINLVVSVNYNPMDELGEVIELVLPFDLSSKTDIEIFRYHGEAVDKFTKLSTKPTENFQDKTFYLDTENNLIYIYSNKFSVYGFGYNTVANPQTSDNIALYISIAVISLLGLGTAIYFNRKKAYN